MNQNLPSQSISANKLGSGVPIGIGIGATLGAILISAVLGVE